MDFFRTIIYYSGGQNSCAAYKEIPVLNDRVLDISIEPETSVSSFSIPRHIMGA